MERGRHRSNRTQADSRAYQASARLAIRPYNDKQNQQLVENRHARECAADNRGGGGGGSHPRSLPTGVKPEDMKPKLLAFHDMTETQWKEFRGPAANYALTESIDKHSILVQFVAARTLIS